MKKEMLKKKIEEFLQKAQQTVVFMEELEIRSRFMYMISMVS